MIKRFSDHAANERTFLAWIRTAIAVEAFGFLVEKFDVFLEVATRTGGVAPPSVVGETVSDVVGLLLLLLGGLIVVLATLRFRRLSVAIDSADEQATYGARIDYVVVGLLAVFGGVLFAYMSYSVLHVRQGIAPKSAAVHSLA